MIDNKKLNIQAGTDFPTCDTFAYLHGTPLEPGQTGEWTWAGSTSSESFSGGDGPVFDNNSISNPEVSGLFYNDDGRGYANAFTWHIHDDNTGCDGYANVIVASLLNVATTSNSLPQCLLNTTQLGGR